jgi:hypothetical protein
MLSQKNDTSSAAPSTSGGTEGIGLALKNRDSSPQSSRPGTNIHYTAIRMTLLCFLDSLPTKLMINRLIWWKYYILFARQFVLDPLDDNI